MQESALLKFKETDVSINAQRYAQTLDRLHKAIKNKCPGMLSSDVIILRDNARPYVAKECVKALARKKWDFLEHPTYSSDPVVPCDYHMFR
ncbi:histone-lysine N-methyltransferase SETMAR [Trichonephila inaurata madagascariensis]|uniref:Histone-lysine N-methyltransferase SETMAR n=1 Tax=Trichonephila inaurata madagascariensis TaxID=2747483 RepID=A0A8X6X0N4_9ARAC|nr:histone-lysine N-methyltransferase SETMAR [Trichonephila inaurata madagascariensis]